MKDHPILFTAENVRAILADRKTHTRRIFKLPKWAHPHDKGEDIAGETPQVCHRDSGCLVDVPCPYGECGSHLWVRGTFQLCENCGGLNFRATANENGKNCSACDEFLTLWKPSIFMPRWASRLTLEIKSINVERLQDISEADALAEGIQTFSKDGRLKKYWPGDPCDGELKCAWVEMPRTAVEAYKVLWESINGAQSWKDNPWVWVLEFQLLTSNS